MMAYYRPPMASREGTLLQVRSCVWLGLLSSFCRATDNDGLLPTTNGQKGGYFTTGAFMCLVGFVEQLLQGHRQ